MKKCICYCFYNECLLSIILNETTCQFSKRCIEIKSNNFWFYRSLIPDATIAVCFDCVFNILKVRTYRKTDSINEMLNRNSYLVFAPVAAVLYRDGTETDIVGPENIENCWEFVGCFFDGPWDRNFILNHFCIECKFCLLRLIRTDLNQLSVNDLDIKNNENKNYCCISQLLWFFRQDSF